MSIIIGIDPGSRITGYGVIQAEQNHYKHIAHGSIYLNEKSLFLKLKTIFLTIQDILQQFNPNEAAIEQVFMHQNPGSALKLGQARGAAIVALTVPVVEYSARQVKLAMVGYGAATKEQIQHMVKRLLNISEAIQADAADALAIALCHAFSKGNIKYTGLTRRRKSSRKGWAAVVV